MAIYRKKLNKNALLKAICERQVLYGLRSRPPRILPMAMTTHGECCPGTGDLLGWLVNKFERLHNEGEHDEGPKVMQLVAGFRNTPRTSLQVRGQVRAVRRRD
jgi:hypothetical protein